MDIKNQKQYDGMKGAARPYHTSAMLVRAGAVVLDLVASKEQSDVTNSQSIIPQLVLISLSCEISLKALYFKYNEKQIKGHKQNDLYRQLPRDVQDDIKTKMQPDYPNFDEQLEQNSEIFVEWRYYYEEAQSAGFTFMENFSGTLASAL